MLPPSSPPAKVTTLMNTRLLASLSVLALVPAVRADGQCCVPCPVPCVPLEQRTVVRYRTEHRTQQRPVQKTVYRTVCVTEMREVEDTVLVEDWADESLRAAKRAYDWPVGKGPIPTGTTLGRDYAAFADPIIRERIAQAGVRLANELNAIFP